MAEKCPQDYADLVRAVDRLAGSQYWTVRIETQSFNPRRNRWHIHLVDGYYGDSLEEVWSKFVACRKACGLPHDTPEAVGNPDLAVTEAAGESVGETTV